tara:strand:- start:3623 stop:4291 length:669 start_codon:yes stop_codon:yes gene_type:complete
MDYNKAITFEKSIGSIAEERRRRVLAQTNPDTKAVKDWVEVCSLFNEKENKQLDIVYDFSKRIKYKHEGLSSEIYFSHPLRVASLVAIISEMKSINYPILGLLHNVIEVSDVSTTSLASTFGASITEQIETLTVDRSLQWDNLYKKDYYERIKAQPHSCRTVKIIDKLDNLFMLHTNPNNEIKKKYLNEIETYIQPMVSQDLPKIEDYFLKLVHHCKQTAIN